jgi:hypothetical protein
MINCTFIYQGSDSLSNSYKVHVVPRVGERLYIRGNSYFVKEVYHEIEPGDEHKITVIYSESN